MLAELGPVCDFDLPESDEGTEAVECVIEVPGLSEEIIAELEADCEKAIEDLPEQDFDDMDMDWDFPARDDAEWQQEWQVEAEEEVAK